MLVLQAGMGFIYQRMQGPGRLITQHVKKHNEACIYCNGMHATYVSIIFPIAQRKFLQLSLFKVRINTTSLVCTKLISITLKLYTE